MLKTLLLVFALGISCRALGSPVTDEIKMDGNVSKKMVYLWTSLAALAPPKLSLHHRRR